MTWNDSCATAMRHPTDPTPIDYCNSGTRLIVAAGTGGFSAWYTKPTWQSGVTGLGNTASSRLVPDVSLFSASGSMSRHALIFCMSDSANDGHPCVYDSGLVAFMNASGGTSYASPAMAGIQALINQRRGQATGNLAPILYGLAAVQFGDGVNPPPSTLAACDASLGASVDSNCIFHDVTVGDTTVPCDAGTPNCYGSGANNIGLIKDFDGNAAYNAGQGWDYATGLGSVNVTNLVEAVYQATTPVQ